MHRQSSLTMTARSWSPNRIPATSPERTRSLEMTPSPEMTPAAERKAASLPRAVPKAALPPQRRPLRPQAPAREDLLLPAQLLQVPARPEPRQERRQVMTQMWQSLPSVHWQLSLQSSFFSVRRDSSRICSRKHKKHLKARKTLKSKVHETGLDRGICPL